jgi:hypothetical protein
MLPFAASMRLLRGAGIPTAPYRILEAAAVLDADTLPFGGPYVAKLADLAHRSELGAVRTGLTAMSLPTAVAELRSLAERERVPSDLVIQPQVRSDGEAFLGVQSTELGPLLVVGLGGVMVELIRRISLRLAPFGPREANELLDELQVPQLFAGFRGQRPWDRGGLSRIIVAAARLAAGSSAWLASLDLNPLVFGPDGFVAVDCLCILRDAAPPVPQNSSTT